MTRLVASDIALATLLLLSQRPTGLRISQVAAALGISFSGADRALEILAADNLTSRDGRRYRLGDSARAAEAVRFALASLDRTTALGALARANESVEFCGVDEAGALVVLRRFAEPADVERLRQAVALLTNFQPDATVEVEAKEDLRETLLEDPTPRQRASGMRILAGAVPRTFADRRPHRVADPVPLGRIHETLPLPSWRRLRALARRHGLCRIIAFGSATRSDFRPDSDVDLLVEPTPGRRLGLDDRIDLIVDAERALGRDVDLLVAPIRRVSLAERVGREGVVLYDAAR